MIISGPRTDAPAFSFTDLLLVVTTVAAAIGLFVGVTTLRSAVEVGSEIPRERTDSTVAAGALADEARAVAVAARGLSIGASDPAAATVAALADEMTRLEQRADAVLGVDLSIEARSTEVWSVVARANGLAEAIDRSIMNRAQTANAARRLGGVALTMAMGVLLAATSAAAGVTALRRLSPAMSRIRIPRLDGIDVVAGLRSATIRLATAVKRLARYATS